jgi:transcriptional regulator with XRE-family HTH domain
MNWLGKRIAEARKLRGWTQQELSRRSRLTRSAIASYERGTKAVKVDTLCKIMRVTGIGPHFFFKKPWR